MDTSKYQLADHGKIHAVSTETPRTLITRCGRRFAKADGDLWGPTARVQVDCASCGRSLAAAARVEMWQVYLGSWDNETEDMEPIEEIAEAEEALTSLGVEYATIEADPDSEGTYLVGLVGRYRSTALRGDEVWEENREFQLHIPQS